MSRASGTDRLLRVGELAALTGVSARLLRYYDNQGLLAAERSPPVSGSFTPPPPSRSATSAPSWRRGYRPA